MEVIDIIILIFIALGAIGGFKAGFFKKTVDFVGMFVVVILAFYLKNYVSAFMYTYLPFFNFGGLFKGLEVINILLYEVIAFIIIFSLLLIILRVLLLITGIIEKILKATIILSIPSKILGLIVGAIEMYVYIFIVLVVVTLPIFNLSFLRESKTVDFILNNTLVLSPMSEEIVDTYDDVYEIVDNKNDKTSEELNTEILKVLLDRKFITKEMAGKLVDDNKLHISDESIIK